MNAVELFKRSLGKWESRRWYTYDRGDLVIRYSQFSNEMTSPENFLFPEGISVNQTFKVWNVTEKKLENEMSTILHARPEYVVRKVGYLGEENIHCPVISISKNTCRMMTEYQNGWTHVELFHFLAPNVRARNIRYDGINCSGAFLENRMDELPEITLENLKSICLEG